MQVFNTLAAATDPTAPTAPTTPATSSSSTNPLAPDQLANESTFLKLLMAQVQNQDPMNPTDGVQFLTQLAQFQQLENGMNMGQDIAAIRGDLDRSAALAAATGITTPLQTK